MQVGMQWEPDSIGVSLFILVIVHTEKFLIKRVLLSMLCWHYQTIWWPIGTWTAECYHGFTVLLWMLAGIVAHRFLSRIGFTNVVQFQRVYVSVLRFVAHPSRIGPI